MSAPHRLYLDNAATAPLRPDAKAAMAAAMETVGNPSSVHTEGRAARALIERAREQVAALAGARPKQVVFTSGATEANVTALNGGWERILVSDVEHASVLEPAARLGAETVRVDPNGLVDKEAIARSLGVGDGRALVSLQTVNSETGVIQPVSDIGHAVHEAGGLFHTDAVQAAGKLPLSFGSSPTDFMSLSAHKIGGPAGIGALIVRDDAHLKALIRGGGQELRRRAGTENVCGIAGFGAAAEAARDDLAHMAELGRRRDRFEHTLRELCPGLVVSSAEAPRIATISNIALPGTSAEALVIMLDLAGAAVSAGSACSSGKVSKSHVLAAMGANDAVVRGALRISLGWANGPDDLDDFINLYTSKVPLKSDTKTPYEPSRVKA